MKSAKELFNQMKPVLVGKSTTYTLIRAFSEIKAFYIFWPAALASEDVTISKPQIFLFRVGEGYLGPFLNFQTFFLISFES